MKEAPIIIDKKRKSIFIDKVKELLPDGGNLNACLTCGACSSGCPATGFDNMDPRKFIRMASLGLDDLIAESNWPWYCTMCQRCIYVCPMKIDIPQLVYNARQLRPRDQRPVGIAASCDLALKNETLSAMGTTMEDFEFVVEDVLEEYREAQPEFSEMEAPIDKEGAELFINQNSREPMTEPDEMVPLWKILHLAKANWTYGSKAWAGENYCLFLSDNDGWRHITQAQTDHVHKLKCKTYLNTE